MTSIDLHVVGEPTVSLRPPDDEWSPVTATTVRRIAAMDDPVLRNLWITQSYADLAARILAGLETDQSWCSFATWASNTAGLSIREVELPHVLDAVFRETSDHLDAIAEGANAHPTIVRRLGLVRFGAVRAVRRSSLGHLVEQALNQVAACIAAGNALVYAELAPIFIRLADWLETLDPTEPSPAVDVVLHELTIPSAHEHPLVHSAFRAYVGAALSTDDRQRAQLVLTANIAAVLHEQQRLQANISDALDAALVDLEQDLDASCHRLVPGPIRRWIIRRASDRVAPHVAALWEHVATRLMMTLTVPGQTLHLGHDVPPLPDGTLFPPLLDHVDHVDLCELLAEWDPTHGTGRGSAARDWADIHQRMGYIVNLFRSRQQDLTLTSPPFSELELATMRDGSVPRTV